MESSAIASQYFTVEARIASFKAVQTSKRRASNASTKGSKSIKWPHKFLTPEELAKAGFFYHPSQSSPDNVACFLCHKSMDGWEQGDDPLAEHLKHSPECGWAIVAGIQAKDGGLSVENPASAKMIEARKATFADKWPHESKKGWKCKVKQMVDAGWKYTPTEEYDDMTTCTYCELALDGWEPSDKPLEEHFVRSPDCPFFALINSSHSPAGKKGKAKKGRASKASRLSTQSQLTVASEAPSFLEQTAQEDDSVLTTATMATSQGRKGAKAKKTAVAKGKKLKAKKDEIAEEVPAPEPEDEGFEVKVDVVEPKPTRGRKRKSAESVDASLLVSEAPAPKRRNTRTRASTAIDASALDDTVTEADTEMQKPARKKGRTSTKKTARKASIASIASLRAAVPDDDELDRALLADLERPLTDEEDNKPASIAPIRRGTRLSRITKVDHAMFGAEALEFDEAAIDAELEAMDAESKALPPLPKAKGAKGKQPRKVSAKQQAAAKKAAEAEVANEAEAAAQQEKMQEEKMQEEEAENQITAELEDSVTMQHVSPVALPKGRKAGSRQTSRQIPARATRASALSANDTNSSMADVSHGTIEDIGNETDASVAVQSTTIKGKKARGGKETKSKTAKRGASKNTEEIVSKTEIALEEINVSAMDVDTDDVPTATQEVEAEPEELMEDALSEELMLIDTKGDAEEIRPPIPEAQETIAMAPSPSPARTRVSAAIKNKATKVQAQRPRSPSPSPREATPESPQSSDAENHPPSSKPSATSKKQLSSTPAHSATTIPLAASTPQMSSPSKRNIIAGLQSEHQWTAVDLDLIFLKSPADKNAPRRVPGLLDEALEKARSGEMTSPEIRMSVEEWIQYNAASAEEKFRNECERMVGIFESEGGRAMRSLEGIMAEEDGM